MPVSLQQLKIDSPCPVPWETMHGDSHVRYCQRCDLHVHNLSAMTSDQASKFVDAREGRTCVAYVPAAEGGPITLDYEKRRRRFTWKFALILGTLGATVAAAAQSLLLGTKPAPPPMMAGGLRARPQPTTSRVILGDIALPCPPPTTQQK